MLVDANLLLYAVDAESQWHDAAAEWWEATLNDERRVGLPWQTIGAFLRISTHPRVTTRPLSPAEATGYVDAWLDAPPVWVPPTGERTASILTALMRAEGVTANLVTDAQLAALAIEHGLVVCSTDADFARFPDVRWENPLRR